MAVDFAKVVGANREQLVDGVDHFFGVAQLPIDHCAPLISRAAAVAAYRDSFRSVDAAPAATACRKSRRRESDSQTCQHPAHARNKSMNIERGPQRCSARTIELRALHTMSIMKLLCAGNCAHVVSGGANREHDTTRRHCASNAVRSCVEIMQRICENDGVGARLLARAPSYQHHVGRRQHGRRFETVEIVKRLQLFLGANEVLCAAAKPHFSASGQRPIT